MQVEINNIWLQNWIVFALLSAFVVGSLKRIPKAQPFDQSLTEELKGFAILTILFGHIGYFLSRDQSFLYPLSILSGVGVNLFLFLSGLGLSLSQLNKPLSIIQFYRRRLLRLFVPMWIILAVYWGLDWLVLGRTYQTNLMLDNLVGWFPQIDLYREVNSPLWYFSLILFYYLIFPLIWIKKAPIISAFVLYLISFWAVDSTFLQKYPSWDLYDIHYLAFPLGIAAALLKQKGSLWESSVQLVRKVQPNFRQIAYYLGLSTLIFIFGYSAIHSAVGTVDDEQYRSLITMFSLVVIFLIKPVQSTFLNLLGEYSYEIYLIHWPLMSRYDIFYKVFPAGIATIIYLGVLLALSWGLRQLVNRLFQLRA